MLDTLRDLIDHKIHATAAMLAAIGRNSAAAADPELRDLLHHILLANRFWLLAVLGAPFDHDKESRPSDSFDGLVQRYADLHEAERAWLGTATESDLERVLEDPLIPGGECSVAQAFLQVCLHTHGHRAQAAKMLRRLGGAPPQTDFINWLAGRRG